MNARNAILTLFFQKKRSFHRFYVCLLSIFVKPHHYKLFLIPLALEFRPLCSLQFPTWNIKKELERSFIILPPPLSSQQESVLQRLVVSLEFFLSSCLRRYRVVLRALVLTFLKQITLTTCSLDFKYCFGDLYPTLPCVDRSSKWLWWFRSHGTISQKKTYWN